MVPVVAMGRKKTDPQLVLTHILSNYVSLIPGILNVSLSFVHSLHLMHQMHRRKNIFFADEVTMAPPEH